MNYNQNPQLPPDVPTQLFVNGLPHRMPFQITTQFPRPFFQGMADYLAGVLANEIQMKANMDYSRKAVFYRVASNFFNNQIFLTEVASVSVFAEFLVLVKGMNDPRAAIHTACEHYCCMLAAAEAMMYPAILQTMTQAQQNEVYAWDANFKNLRPQLAQFIAQCPPQTMQGGGGYQQNPQQQYDNRYAGNGWQANQQPQQQWNQQPQQQGAWNPQNWNNTVSRTASGTGHIGQLSYSGGGTTAWGGSAVRSSNSNAASADLFCAPVDEPELVVEINDRQNNAAPTPTPTAPLVPYKPEYKEPTYAHDIVFGDAFEDQTEQPVQKQHVIKEIMMDATTRQATVVDHAIHLPAATSKMKLVPNTKQIYPKCYDLQHSRAMQIVHNNVVIGETIENQEEGMDFKDHDLLYMLQPRIQEEGESGRDFDTAREVFNSILRQSNLEALLEEAARLQGAVELPEGALIPLEGAIEIPDIGNPDHEGFVGRIQIFLTENGVDYNPNFNAVSMTHTEESPWDHAGIAAASTMAIQNSTTWEQLIIRFKGYREHIYTGQWHKLHDKLTEAVNEAVLVYVGINLHIDSFIDDVLPLGQAILKKHGNFFYERYLDIVPYVAKRVLTAAMVELEKPESDETEVVVAEGAAKKDDELKCTLVEYTDITILPLASKDLPFMMHGKVGTVTLTRTPDLYNAIDTRFKRKPFDVGRVIFQTNDNRRFHAYRPLTDRENVYLVRAEA